MEKSQKPLVSLSCQYTVGAEGQTSYFPSPGGRISTEERLQQKEE